MNLLSGMEKFGFSMDGELDILADDKPKKDAAQKTAAAPVVKTEKDFIIDKKVPAEEIKKGDIITYDCLSGDLAGQTITHRVVTDPESRNGTYYFRTQGDREGAPLDDIISYDQVEGKFVNKLPWLNKLYTFFLSPYGLLTFILIIIVLFGYEMISLIVSYKSLDEKDDDYYEPKAKKRSKKRKK